MCELKSFPFSDFIKDELDVRDWDVDYFSKKLKKDEKFVSKLLKDRLPITKELLQDISNIFNHPFDYWEHIHAVDMKYRLEGYKNISNRNDFKKLKKKIQRYFSELF